MKEITFALLSTLLVVYLLQIGFKRQIDHECAVWNAQAVEYDNFYWTDWQIDQCHPNTLPNTDIPYRNDTQKYNQY